MSCRRQMEVAQKASMDARERIFIQIQFIITDNGPVLFPVPDCWSLLRGLAGLRLRRLNCGIIAEFPVNFIASFPELIHALPQASRQVRQLFRPEEDKND